MVNEYSFPLYTEKHTGVKAYLLNKPDDLRSFKNKTPVVI